MAVLQGIQDLLEELNGVTTEVDVRDYIVSSDIRAEIPGAVESIPEQLFISENDDEMELALYIEPGILEALQSDLPQSRLHNGNIENFCIAVEGVSHFVKVVWSAQVGRTVSALELEIQAEVDKFVGAWRLLETQGMPRAHAARALKKLLFEQYDLREEVPREEAERYHLATKVARGFCETLIQRYPHADLERCVLRDTRQFYRSGLRSMLRI